MAANLAVADSTMWSRIIHAWPNFALIGAYELLIREFRTAAKSVRGADAESTHLGTETFPRPGTNIGPTSPEPQEGWLRCLPMVK